MMHIFEHKPLKLIPDPLHGQLLGYGRKPSFWVNRKSAYQTCYKLRQMPGYDIAPVFHEKSGRWVIKVKSAPTAQDGITCIVDTSAMERARKDKQLGAVLYISNRDKIRALEVREQLYDAGYKQVAILTDNLDTHADIVRTQQLLESDHLFVSVFTLEQAIKEVEQ